MDSSLRPLLQATLEILGDRARRHRDRRARALRAGLYRDDESLTRAATNPSAWEAAYASVLKDEIVAGELRTAGEVEARFHELHDFQLARDATDADEAAALFAVTWERVAARMGGLR